MSSQKVEVGQDSVLVRNASIVSSDLDGETVLLNIESGKYLGIKEVGSSIWKLLESPITLGEILSALVTEYDVSREVCEERTLRFIDELISAGLVSVS